jgi:hypothetical protein
MKFMMNKILGRYVRAIAGEVGPCRHTLKTEFSSKRPKKFSLKKFKYTI